MALEHQGEVARVDPAALRVRLSAAGALLDYFPASE
jgi:hypothetical protein